MIVLNYAHPFTSEQLAQLTALTGESAIEVRTFPSQVDRARPVAEVAREFAAAAEFTPEEWQTVAFVLNPPALAPLALALIAELHGRCGFFPPILNIRPKGDTRVPRYEVAEVLELQRIRDNARRQRDL